VTSSPAIQVSSLCKGESALAVNREGNKEMTLIGKHRIAAKVSANASRKLGIHLGAAVLQGGLVDDRGELSLVEACFQWLDPKPDPKQQNRLNSVGFGWPNLSEV
jgi:hypothetical protein